MKNTLIKIIELRRLLDEERLAIEGDKEINEYIKVVNSYFKVINTLFIDGYGRKASFTAIKIPTN